jgi:thiol-disulfide isomerase/thioredoxin
MHKWLKTTAFASLSAVAVALSVASTPAATVSPAPDMPAEWFLHDDEATAAKHKALIGKPAPAIKVSKWFQGEVKPEEMKGKVVILDIWATWCGPCKTAMPHTDELAKKFADKGVVIATICSDGDQDFIPKFIKEKNLSLPMAWDDGTATHDAFAAQWFPTYVAIDRAGKVRAIGFSHDAMEKVIEKLLAEPTASE